MISSRIQDAILLARAPLRETSLLLSWLSRDAGRIKTALRGARRYQIGLPDLFECHEIIITPSRSSEIHTLKEHRLVAPNEGVRTDYHRFALAGYFTRLIEAATEPEHPLPEIFDLLARALEHLSSGPRDLSRLPGHFERRLAELLGVLGRDNRWDGASALRAAGVRLPAAREKLVAQFRGNGPAEGGLPEIQS